MNKEKINNILTRGVAEVIVLENLAKKLESGKKLRIKLGIDPTGSDLTLGHAVVLRKLRQFQDLGHTVIFLFGGYTATIGDPTGKNETRPVLTIEEVAKNAENYLEQAGLILDIDKCEVRNNKEWLENLSLKETLHLMAQKSVQQIMARQDFRQRTENGVDILMQEFTYPLLQGYDSVVLKNDVEIGGSDQLFNIMVGRDLQKKYGISKTGQDCLTCNLLVGTDGVEKMSKSLGNYIALKEKPNEMFGKILSIPDKTMFDYYECLTDFNMDEVKDEISRNPRDTKVKLAKEIVTWLHSAKDAESAYQDFQTKFVKKEVPDEMPEFKVAEDTGILDLISKICNFAESNGEARRLIMQGAVSLDGDRITDSNFVVQIPTKKLVLKVGKRKFARISA